MKEQERLKEILEDSEKTAKAAWEAHEKATACLELAVSAKPYSDDAYAEALEAYNKTKKTNDDARAAMKKAENAYEDHPVTRHKREMQYHRIMAESYEDSSRMTDEELRESSKKHQAKLAARDKEKKKIKDEFPIRIVIEYRGYTAYVRGMEGKFSEYKLKYLKRELEKFVPHFSWEMWNKALDWAIQDFTEHAREAQSNAMNLAVETANVVYKAGKLRAGER